MSMTDLRKEQMHHEAHRERLAFNLVVAVVFVVCFAAIALARLLPRRWRLNVSGHDENKSVVGAAKTAALCSVPYIFM